MSSYIKLRVSAEGEPFVDRQVFEGEKVDALSGYDYVVRIRLDTVFDDESANLTVYSQHDNGEVVDQHCLSVSEDSPIRVCRIGLSSAVVGSKGSAEVVIEIEKVEHQKTPEWIVEVNTWSTNYLGGRFVENRQRVRVAAADPAEAVDQALEQASSQLGPGQWNHVGEIREVR